MLLRTRQAIKGSRSDSKHLQECGPTCGCNEPAPVEKKKKAKRSKPAAESFYLYGLPSIQEALSLAVESMECGCYEKMQAARDALREAVPQAVEEAWRKRIGVRRFRNIKHIGTLKSSKWKKVGPVPKMHHPVRKGPVNNRHR